MRNKISINCLDLKYFSTPSLELSLLKHHLSINGLDASVNYLNIKLADLHNAFLRNLTNKEDIDYTILFLNYIAIKKRNKQLYNKVKTRLMSIKPQLIGSDRNAFDSHMTLFAHELDSLLNNIISEICTPDILYYKFSADKNQEIIACIIAHKIKQHEKDNIIVIDGINSKTHACALLKKYPQFDYAIYGKSVYPLIAFSKEILSRKINSKNLINTISKNNLETSGVSKNKNVFYDGLLDYSDFFEQRKYVDSLKGIGVSIPIQINQNKFEVNYIISQIKDVINKYNAFDFIFRGYISLSRNCKNVESLLKELIFIKEKHSEMIISETSIDTRNMTASIVRDMALAGFAKTNIHLSSSSLAYNFLFIKYASLYGIQTEYTINTSEILEDNIFELLDNIHYLRFFRNESFSINSVGRTDDFANRRSQEIISYYAKSRHEYKLYKKGNCILYREFLSGEIISEIEFELGSLDWYILKKANNKIVSINQTISDLKKRQEEYLDIEIFNTIEELRKENLLYASDDYSEMVSVINIDMIL